MDQFTYVDIFATKGLEYLLVIAFLVAFLFFIRALFAESGERHAPQSAAGPRRSPRSGRRDAED